VYLPFLKYRNYVIVNVNIETARVFSTKERAPFSICLELVQEEEEYFKDEHELKVLHKKLNRPIIPMKN
jgi:phosphatidylinositol 4-kinase